MFTDFDSNLVFAKHISWCEINNEVFVFNELNGNIFLFKSAQREIWKLIDSSNTILSIIGLAKNEYTINPEKAIEIIQKFHNKGLVEVVKI